MGWTRTWLASAASIGTWCISRAMGDVSAILTPGRVLTADDVLALSDLVEPPWKRRQRRLDARDRAIREALDALAPVLATAAPAELCKRLRRYLSGPEWPSDRVASVEPADPWRRWLYRIGTGNDGRTLSRETLGRIARGSRTPWS